VYSTAAIMISNKVAQTFVTPGWQPEVECFTFDAFRHHNGKPSDTKTRVCQLLVMSKNKPVKKINYSTSG